MVWTAVYRQWNYGSGLRVNINCAAGNSNFYDSWHYYRNRTVKKQKDYKGNHYKCKQYSDYEPWYCYCDWTDDFIFLPENRKGISDYAPGTCLFLYTLCDYKRIPEGTKSGPRACQCRHGPWRNPVSGVDQGDSSYD